MNDGCCEAKTEHLADEDGPTNVQSGKDTHEMTINDVFLNHFCSFALRGS